MVITKSNVGAIVELTIDCLGNKKGGLGVVCDDYEIGDIPGVFVIFENGEYCGFSKPEQESFFKIFGYHHECSSYKFKNVMKLSEDFKNGFFNEAFRMPV